MEQARWPQGFRCPRCAGAAYSRVHGRTHIVPRQTCRHQTSLIAGTVMQGIKLPLILWSLAIYLISQAKTGLSALALKRSIGVSYPTEWLVQHKLMQAMTSPEQMYVLEGKIQIDDAYLGGEHSRSCYAFNFSKYATRYLGAFAYRFNRRFDLSTLHTRLLIAATTCPQILALGSDG